MTTPAALFDIDGTLASSNVVATLADFRLADASTVKKLAVIAGFLPRAAYYMALDWRDRRRFLEVFFRRYAGVSVADHDAWAQRAVRRYWARRVYGEALDLIAHHRQQGRHVVILSGGLYETLLPLARWLGADTLLATRVGVEDGRFTGEIAGEPLIDDAKARATLALAREKGLDLERSYAYADSISDRPMLESVGLPVAVNPDRPLKRLASARGWPVERWERKGGLEQEAGP